jgi:hypothetical protein
VGEIMQNDPKNDLIDAVKKVISVKRNWTVTKT